MILNLRIARLPHGADLPLPAYQSAFAAGLDLYAAVPADAPIVLAPGARAKLGASERNRFLKCGRARGSPPVTASRC